MPYESLTAVPVMVMGAGCCANAAAYDMVRTVIGFVRVTPGPQP